MTRLLRRAGIVVGATTATLAMTAGASFAHECYVVNRSDKSQAGVKSQVWFTVDFVAELVAEEIWTPEQGACITAEAARQGVRTSITLMGKVPEPHNGVLGSKNPNSATKAGDGKGIDHFFSGGAVGALIPIVIGCGAEVPEI